MSRTVCHWTTEYTGCLSEQHFTAWNVALTNSSLLLYHKEQLIFPPRICCYFLSVFVQEFVFLCVCVFFLNRRISLSLILLLTHWEQFDVGNFISFFSPLVISCHMISTCHLWNTRYVVSKSQMHYIVSIFVWTVTLLMQFLSSSLWNQSIQTLVIKV